MKDLQVDFDWIKKCLDNKDNKFQHYPMLQKLVHLFSRKHLSKNLGKENKTNFLFAIELRDRLDKELKLLLSRL